MSLDIHVRCKGCQSVYAIKRIHDTVETPVSYCIFCGGFELLFGEEDLDYWQTLATELGLPGKGNLIKDMFDIWTPEKSDPIRFVDFAKKMIAESLLTS